MNYQKIYTSLIDNAKRRDSIDGYKERHHIIPSSLGGTDNLSNLVYLTAREHFIAHCLIAHIHGGTQWAAVVKFKGSNNNYMNSRLYEIAKKQMAADKSKRMKGVKRPGTGINISASLKGKSKPDGFGIKVSERLIGIKRPTVSEIMKGNRRGEACKGKRQTPEHVLKAEAGRAKVRFDKKCIKLNDLIDSIFYKGELNV